MAQNFLHPQRFRISAHLISCNCQLEPSLLMNAVAGKVQNDSTYGNPLGLYWVMLGLYWGYSGIMENETETTLFYIQSEPCFWRSLSLLTGWN